VERITRLRKDGFSIGQASRRTGVKLETIRYYERIGILTGPPRTATGHRVYSSDDLRKLAFVRHGRQLGFPLSDIRKLLTLREAGPACCDGARDIALRHLACIRTRIADFSRLARLLERAIHENAASLTLCCPVMELLDRPAEGSLFDDAPNG
jgi:MerR family transcriptional regulator, mercuric resistance operon regulatory protein